MAFYDALARVSRPLIFEDLEQGLVEVLVRRCCADDPDEILSGPLLTSSKRSLHDLAQVLLRRPWDLVETPINSCLRDDPVQFLNRRSCGDPGEVLSKRSFYEDLADAMS